jgi:phage tail-like protein
MIGYDDKLGLQNRFKVEVGGIDLGSWTKCEGLDVNFTPEKQESGGEYGLVYWLPGKVVWGKVTLTRALTATDSPALRSWLSKKLAEYSDPTGNVGYADGDATITLYDAHGGPVISWELRGVHVEKWKGPTFDATSGKVALESLTLVHEGFL